MSSAAFKHHNRWKLHGFAQLPGVRFPTILANQPRIIMSDRHELALVGWCPPGGDGPESAMELVEQSSRRGMPGAIVDASFRARFS